MDIHTLVNIIASANSALASRKKLAKLHDAHVARTNSGGMTRANTTTYNANASSAVDDAKFHEAEIKRLDGVQ